MSAINLLISYALTFGVFLLIDIVWLGLIGFFTYATYDLTNLATMKNWPLTIRVGDMMIINDLGEFC
jgi:uncharacterized membrane protein